MICGEICVFQIPLLAYNGIFAVRCDCYPDYEDRAYRNTFYCNGREILHTESGLMIDTADKAKKAIIETIKLREALAEKEETNESNGIF